MSIRRTSLRDERRRRVLVDEVVASPARGRRAANSTQEDQGKVAPGTYTAAARADQQVRVTDLLPIGPGALALWMTLGLLFLALVLGFYYFTLNASRMAPTWLPIDVSVGDRLIGWYSSILLALAACVTAIVFGLRRHRLDDYRGRYRIWCWIAPVFMLASIDATVGFHWHIAAVTSHLLEPFGQWSLLSSWLILAFAIVFVIGLRLLWEMRCSRGSVAVLSLAGLSYVATLVVHSQRFVDLADDERAFAQVVAATLGHTFLLFAVTVYARYVFLDAQGLIAIRRSAQRGRRNESSARPPAKNTTKSTVESTAKSAAKPRLAQETVAPAAHSPIAKPPSKTSVAEPEKPPAQKSKLHERVAAARKNKQPATPQPSQPTNDDEKLTNQDRQDILRFIDSAEEDTSHLSKAEKKRLRKEKRRQRRAA